MGDKLRFMITNCATGESEEYLADNIGELQQSFDCVNDHFRQIARAKQNLNKSRKSEHIRLMQAKVAEYIAADGFKASYSAVFMLMMCNAKYGGRVVLTKPDIGDKLKYSRQTVNRAISHLLANRMIYEREYESRSYFYIDSSAGQKGHHSIAGTEQIAKTIRGKAKVTDIEQARKRKARS